MKKKLLLINPVNEIHTYGNMTKLAFGIIAALTPPNWDIEVIDEGFEPFVFKEADLVGLTAFTNTINRAYKIANMYYKQGIQTVLGGVHASFMPDEAIKYVNTIVIGEVESVWRDVIADFEKGQLKKIYHGSFTQLSNTSSPKYDFLSSKTRVGSIQTTRGCPMSCTFCSVTAFNGNRYRHRPIKDVLDDLEKIPRRRIFFFDDNIVGYGKENEH